MGGSNGGLLMGVMFTQRPDLFHAIVCQVPLLDMLRYQPCCSRARRGWRSMAIRTWPRSAPSSRSCRPITM